MQRQISQIGVPDRESRKVIAAQVSFELPEQIQQIASRVAGPGWHLGLDLGQNLVELLLNPGHRLKLLSQSLDHRLDN